MSSFVLPGSGGGGVVDGFGGVEPVVGVFDLDDLRGSGVPVLGASGSAECWRFN
jgi:hypothetical protein